MSECQAQLSDRFVTLIPQIENFAGARARHLDPEARQEVIQNTLALCWFRFLDLARAGKHRNDDVIASMVYHSITHPLAARPAHGREKSRAKCVLDSARRGLRGVAVEPLAPYRHVAPEPAVPTR